MIAAAQTSAVTRAQTLAGFVVWRSRGITRPRPERQAGVLGGDFYSRPGLKLGHDFSATVLKNKDLRSRTFCPGYSIAGGLGGLEPRTSSRLNGVDPRELIEKGRSNHARPLGLDYRQVGVEHFLFGASATLHANARRD